MSLADRVLPTDLAVVGLVGVWLVGVGRGLTHPGQLPLGLVAVLFAPGYAVVGAIFPRRETTPLSPGGLDVTLREITGVDRLLFGVVVSLCVVPLVGLGLGVSAVPAQPATITTAVGSVTVATAAAGVARRLRLSPVERFDPRIVTAPFRVRSSLDTDSPVRLLVIVGLLLSVAAVVGGASVTERGEPLTELSVTAADGVADDYPTRLAAGESATVRVGVGNEEGRSESYTLVVVQTGFADGETTDRRRTDTVDVTAADGETASVSHTIRPAVSGERVRVAFLLYRTQPDGPVDRASAYRSVHLWIELGDG